MSGFRGIMFALVFSMLLRDVSAVRKRRVKQQQENPVSVSDVQLAAQGGKQGDIDHISNNVTVTDVAEEKWWWSPAPRRRRSGVSGKLKELGLPSEVDLEYKLEDFSDGHCDSGQEDCFLAWGSKVSASSSVTLHNDIVAGAKFSADVTFHYSFLWKTVNVNCDFCGQTCVVDPVTIAGFQLMEPFEFEMPPCPIKADTFTKTLTDVEVKNEKGIPKSLKVTLNLKAFYPDGREMGHVKLEGNTV